MLSSEQEEPMIIPKLVKLVGQKEGELGRRLTQQEIAEMTGINAHTISRWMRGEPMARVEGVVLLPLMEFFDCTPNDLFDVKRISRGRKK